MLIRLIFSSKEEQYDKLIKTAGNNWKIFDGDANPLYDAYYVETTAPKYKSKFRLMPKKKLKGSLKLKMVGSIPNACLLLEPSSETGA